MFSMLIDDVRDYHADIVCRNAKTAFMVLQALNISEIEFLMLDHDLGDEQDHVSIILPDETIKEYRTNGTGICCYLEDLEHLGAILPLSVQLVTSSPVGRVNMQLILRKLYPYEDVHGVFHLVKPEEVSKDALLS